MIPQSQVSRSFDLKADTDVDPVKLTIILSQRDRQVVIDGTVLHRAMLLGLLERCPEDDPKAHAVVVRQNGLGSSDEIACYIRSMVTVEQVDGLEVWLAMVKKAEEED